MSPETAAPTDPTTIPPAPSSPPPAETPKFTQGDVDKIVTERLARAAKVAEDRALQERQKAEQQKLTEQSEFKTLSEQHAAKLAQLEPELESHKTRYATLADRLNKQIDTGMKDWPAEARRMVPALDDVAARLDAYENMRGLLDKGTLAPRQPGNSAGPRPTAGAPDAAKRVEADLRATGRYTSI